MNGLKPGKLDQLLLMGGPELTQELLQRLVEFEPRSLVEADPDEAERRLHRLNSDASWVGARGLQQQAEQLEMLVVDGGHHSLEQHLPQLESVLAEVKPSLQKALEEISS